MSADEEERRWAVWMAAAQDGDLESYDRLLVEVEAVLRAFLRNKLREPELVEECLQEALFAIHKARHTFDPRRRFKPWVFALANYKTIDVLRRRSTRRRYEVPEFEGWTAGQATPTGPESPFDASRALEGLAAPYREAVMLTKLLGYTLDEAALRAGVSKAAMRSRVHRGIHQLRRVLGRELA